MQAFKTAASMPTPEYVPLSANQEHIDRHFAHSVEPGSTFLPMSEDKKQTILNMIDARLKDAFDAFLTKGETPSRTILQLEFPKNIGTSPLVIISAEDEENFTTVTRDPGQPFEAKVKVTEATDIPQTHIVTVIAGPYGPTGKWGSYTMFPGAEVAPVFPNAGRQSPEQFQESAQYWNTHGMLVQPEKMDFLLQREKMLALTRQASASGPATPSQG